MLGRRGNKIVSALMPVEKESRFRAIAGGAGTGQKKGTQEILQDALAPRGSSPAGRAFARPRGRRMLLYP